MLTNYLFAFSQYELSLNKSTYEQNERIEFKVHLPQKIEERILLFVNSNPKNPDPNGINPFLSWEFKCLVELTNENNETEIIHGFYFQEIERNSKNWEYKETKDPIRARFSTNKTDKWIAKAMVYINNRMIAQTEEIEFNTITGNHSREQISVHPSKKYFSRGDKIIIPTGINLPFPYIDNNMIWNNDKNAHLTPLAWETYRKDLKKYSLTGGEYFRFFMHPSSTDIEFEHLGNYSKRMHFAYEIDEMLTFCEDNNMTINFNFLYHSPIMVLADYFQFRWDYADFWHNPEVWPYADIHDTYAYASAFNSKKPSDMFLKPEPLAYIKEKFRYIHARFGYSSSIGTYEILCEPWHINEDWYNKDTPYEKEGPKGDEARKAVHLYHKEMAAYLKNELQAKQPIGAVGKFPRQSDNIFSHQNNPNFKYADSTWFDENIDFISISYYAKDPHKFIYSKRGKTQNECESGENSYHCVIKKLQESYNKPIIFGESDHGDDTHECSNLVGHQLDIMKTFTTGTAGHYLWGVFMHGPTNNNFDERNSWKGIVASEKVYNTSWMNELLQEEPAFGRVKSKYRSSKNDIKHTEYIISQNNDKAFGYIHNTTFNISTVKETTLENTESPCFMEQTTEKTIINWRPQRTKIEGLSRNENYKINYYSFPNGSFVGQERSKTNRKGDLLLKHPSLIPEENETPLMWFKIDLEKP